MKITKEQLVGLIGESTYKNLKEMAQLKGLRHKHGFQSGQAGGEKLHKNFTMIFLDKNPGEGEPKLIYGKKKFVIQQPERFVHVGWRYFEPDSDDIFFLGDRELDAFLTEYEVEVRQILEASGLDISRVHWTNSRLAGGYGSLPKTDPRRPPHSIMGFDDQLRQSPDTRYKGKPITKQDREDVEQIPWDEKERFLRDTLDWKKEKKDGLYTVIKSILSTEEVTDHMTKCALPTIRPNEREYLDRHNENSNNQIFDYSTHSILYFETQDQFYRSMLARIKGDATADDMQKKDAYQRYQFNKIYSNWEPEKATIEKSRVEKTPVYKLDEKGYKDLGLDVCIMGVLNIKGQMSQDQNTFTWSVQYVSKWGSKLRDNYRIEGGLKPDLDISSTKTCEISKEQSEPQFNRYHVISHNDSIMDCFKQALTEVKDKIMAVRPATAIRKALPTQGQIDIGRPQNP